MYPKLIFRDQPISTEWLAQRAKGIAAGLRRLNLSAGDTAAFMLKNSPDAVGVVLGCRLANIYLVAINWHFKGDEVRHILTDSGAKIVFITRDLLAHAQPGFQDGQRVVVLDEMQTYIVGSDIKTPFDVSGDAAPPGQEGSIILSESFVPYTSGTTGKPKGVRKLPYTPEERARRVADAMGVKRIYYGDYENPVGLLSAPIYHTAPMGFLNHFSNISASLVLEERFDAERTLFLIDKYKVTHAYLVPTMFQRLLKLPPEIRNKYDVGSIRRVTSTGSPCAPELKLDMIEWFGPVITESYASSEAGTITFIESEEWLAHRGSVGKAAARAEIRILDEQRNELPRGKVGMIYVRQHSQPDFTYINNDAARREIEHDGLIALGDLGYLDPEGYLYICDRKADMVISGGVNIYPAEIEEQLLTMPGVSDCAVFGVPDEEFGESLLAAVELAPQARLTEEDVKRYLHQRIAGYKVPRLVTFHESLPREDTGKIFKRRLREPYWQGKTRRV